MITVTATRQLDSGVHAIASVSAGQYGAFESVTLQRGDVAEQVYYCEFDSAPLGHARHDSAALGTYAAAMLGTILRQRKRCGHSDGSFAAKGVNIHMNDAGRPARLEADAPDVADAGYRAVLMPMRV